MLGPVDDLPLDGQFIASFSGGVDSVVGTHFLIQGGRRPRYLLHINHHGALGALALQAALSDKTTKLAKAGALGALALQAALSDKTTRLAKAFYQFDMANLHKNIRVYKKHIHGPSIEDYWRRERIRVYEEVYRATNLPIIQFHHLDDCVEQNIIATYIRPRPYKLIPYQSHYHTIRPFLAWKKKKIYDYARKHNLVWYTDKSNNDLSLTRNRIRHKVVPELVKISGSIYKDTLNAVMSERKERKKKENEKLVTL